MKHLFNDISREEKQRILEMHGVKKPLISEQVLNIGNFPTGSSHNVKLKGDASGKVFVLKVNRNNGMSLWCNLILTGREIIHDENFFIEGNTICTYLGGNSSRKKVFELVTNAPSKPKTNNPKPTSECPQSASAQKIFGGSKINLYPDQSQTTPSISQVCVTDIVEIKSDKLDANFEQKEKGFILPTNITTAYNKGEKLKLYFVCGYDYLINNNEKQVGEALSALVGMYDSFEHKLYQENVTAELNKQFCSTSKGGKFVPKVKNSKFASTGGGANSDVA
jgi:hypothetical protein